MTTSTFSSLAMSPPLLGRDVGHVRDAEGFVTFHRSVDHVDGVAARHEVDERRGRPLPAVELPLAHQSTNSRCEGVLSCAKRRPSRASLTLSIAPIAAR